MWRPTADDNEAPVGLSQEHLNAVRRNLFAVNLISNFEKQNLSLSRLAVNSLGFSNVEIRTLMLKDSELLDVSMSGFKVRFGGFENCRIERSEFNNWNANELRFSGPMLNLRMPGLKVDKLEISGAAGVINLSDSNIVQLMLGQGNETKLIIKSSSIEAIYAECPGASVDFSSCTIGRFACRRCMTGMP